MILLVLGGLFAAAGLIMVTAASGPSDIAQRVNGLGEIFLLGGLTAAVWSAIVIRRLAAVINEEV